MASSMSMAEISLLKHSTNTLYVQPCSLLRDAGCERSGLQLHAEAFSFREGPSCHHSKTSELYERERSEVAYKIARADF